MDRGDFRPIAAKRQVRRFLIQLMRMYSDPAVQLRWINMTYPPHSPLRVYALAYWQAVSNATPLDLPRVRDSGS